MTGNLEDLGQPRGAARGVRRWRLRYRGQRRTLTGTRTEAKAALAQFAAEVEQGRIRTADGTVGACLADYLAHTEMAPKTAVETERIIRLHLAPIVAVRLSKLTPSAIEALYRDLGQTRAAATVRRTHAVLHAALERAVRLDLINTNPASRVQPPSGRRSIDIDVDTDSVLAILKAAEPDRRLHTYLTLAAATGCRRGELCALRWRDVDLAAGRLTVRTALSHAGRAVVEKAPKSGKERTVMLPPSAVDALKVWRKDSGRVAGWVFPATVDGLEPWSPVAVTSAFRHLCRRARIDGVRLHDVRHWSASANLRAGMSVAEVAQMLGHSSPAVTLSVYSHAIDQRTPMALDTALQNAK
jgi:integrase